MKPKLAVDIVNVYDTSEALAIRSVLEWWAVQVILHSVGETRDLVRILGGGEKISNHVILMCHGDEKGLVLPEL